MKKTRNVGIAGVFILMLLWPTFVLAQRTAPLTPSDHEAHIVYVPLPADLSPEALETPSEAVKNRLYHVAKTFLMQASQRHATTDAVGVDDRIVVFTDAAGQPVLPDLQRAQQRYQATGQRTPTRHNTNDLTFTFHSPNAPWSDTDLASLQAILGDCYPLAKTIYGEPAFSISVNVRRDPNITFAGLYFPGLNEMVLHDVLTPDPICHELLHAFHDDNLITLSSYEEGMTRAAEVEILNRLPSYPYWNRHHSYGYDVYYDGLNKAKIGAQNGHFFLGYIGVLLRYQLSGYAWAKVLFENASFLADFNHALYDRTVQDPSTPHTVATLIELAAAVQPKVENKLFQTWYAQQGIFDTAPPTGYLLYQRINQFTVDAMYRDPSGTEIMQAGATVTWKIFDHDQVLVQRGTGVTSANGWFDIMPTLPTDYTGRIKVVVTMSSPDGIVRDTTQRFAGEALGVFGIVQNANVGRVTITPLDDPAASVTVDVLNGAFRAPSLATVAGRFRAVFVNSAGQKFQERFNKDASDYFLAMPGR